ncbi:MAG: hypothetical protein HY532_07380 [Chloroflexi bacterium]|nr:hypothetical protein [Chloroflexota bacterium]
MEKFTWDYLLLSFVASFGVLLFVTARSRLRGLYLVKRGPAQVVGIVLTAGAFGWFFLSKPRNIPDTLAGLDGNQQALLFSAGAAAALVSLLLLSSLRNRSMTSNRVLRNLSALRHASYLRLIADEIGSRRKSWNIFKSSQK